MRARVRVRTVAAPQSTSPLPLAPRSGTRKKTPFAGQLAAEKALAKAFEKGVRSLIIKARLDASTTRRRAFSKTRHLQHARTGGACVCVCACVGLIAGACVSVVVVAGVCVCACARARACVCVLSGVLCRMDW